MWCNASPAPRLSARYIPRLATRSLPHLFRGSCYRPGTRFGVTGTYPTALQYTGGSPSPVACNVARSTHHGHRPGRRLLSPPLQRELPPGPVPRSRSSRDPPHRCRCRHRCFLGPDSQQMNPSVRSLHQLYEVVGCRAAAHRRRRHRVFGPVWGLPGRFFSRLYSLSVQPSPLELLEAWRPRPPRHAAHMPECKPTPCSRLAADTDDLPPATAALLRRICGPSALVAGRRPFPAAHWLPHGRSRLPAARSSLPAPLTHPHRSPLAARFPLHAACHPPPGAHCTLAAHARVRQDAPRAARCPPRSRVGKLGVGEVNRVLARRQRKPKPCPPRAARPLHTCTCRRSGRTLFCTPRLARLVIFLYCNAHNLLIATSRRLCKIRPSQIGGKPLLFPFHSSHRPNHPFPVLHTLCASSPAVESVLTPLNVEDDGSTRAPSPLSCKDKLTKSPEAVFQNDTADFTRPNSNLSATYAPPHSHRRRTSPRRERSRECASRAVSVARQADRVSLRQDNPLAVD
ncbi:hypothetical protein GGX14DRAFT_611180 [Mycena pura]|uniref:Uncharacterized protein n=1 Tax=Mycena pura TaxID=153505 RepID=A0AAD6VJ91_9AGAR|nr:hypothetical protein GGX14DRAFT_611180 [Mycena pura]